MTTYDIAIIGFGTVGQGLAEILRDRGGELARDPKARFRVVGISDQRLGSVLDPEGIDPGAALAAVSAGTSLDTLPGRRKGLDGLATIRESGAHIVVEATWTDLATGEPGLGHVREALGRGIHVATTNKGPAALAARELMELAERHRVRFLFEGTVMSGTPVLSFATRSLKGTRIRAVQGILNGTTNYILSEMEGGQSYESALAQAQKLGYAEAVPDADVLGHDAQGKVTILANLVLGASLRPRDVATEGITGITPKHIEEARREGRRYKLVGRAARAGDRVEAQVRPVALSLGDPLASVMGVTNAVTFETDLLGAVSVVGPGAGRLQTGFALLADLLEIARGSAAPGQGGRP